MLHRGFLSRCGVAGFSDHLEAAGFQRGADAEALRWVIVRDNHAYGLRDAGLQFPA